MKTKMKIKELEAEARKVSLATLPILTEGIGFCTILFNFGEGGHITYLSNAERPDMLKALKELIKNIEAEEVVNIKMKMDGEN